MQNLGLFTKYWQPGQVKSRLAIDLGIEVAAAVYRICVEHLAHELRDSADQRCFVVSPNHRADDACFRQFGQWNSVAQGDGDLGDRMMRYFATANSPDDCVVVIGGDCPTVDSRLIGRVFGHLQTSRFVVGPSHDGGYYLLGLRGPWHNAFGMLFHNMPWGTAEVLPRTLSTLRSLQIEPAMLPADQDIDTLADLKGLLSRLSGDRDRIEFCDALHRVLKIENGQGIIH